MPSFDAPGRPRFALAFVMLALAPTASWASFLSGDALDKMANALALFILVAVPIGGIVLFWMVHVLPEKVAEKRHHPQKDAIKMLCLLSLVFGGLLWPLAWLWAYSKPVLHKIAYGTDKHEDYYEELAEKDAEDARLLKEDVSRLRQELNVLDRRGGLPEELESIREQLEALEARMVVPKLTEEVR